MCNYIIYLVLTLLCYTISGMPRDNDEVQRSLLFNKMSLCSDISLALHQLAKPTIT